MIRPVFRRLMPLLAALPLYCAAASVPPADLRDAVRAPNHRYEQIVIMSPHDQETVFDNTGHLDIEILMSPATSLEDHESVEIYLDGRPASRAVPTPTGFSIDQIDRGSHWLQARIADASGRTVIASAPVQVFMWQASRLFPNRP